MIYYSVTAAVLIGLVSMLLVFTLKKLELPSYRVVITAGVGSIAVSLLFPVIFELVSSLPAIAGNGTTIINELSISAVISLVLIFIISVTVSLVIPDSTFAVFASKLKRKSSEVNDEQSTLLEQIQTDGNYLKAIFENTILENRKETADIEENGTKTENNLEKSVDSGENTDKMGIETFKKDEEQSDSLLQKGLEVETAVAVNNTYDSISIAETSSELQAESLTIEDCINEAFRLKQSGDYEGAIINFMYALDRKPKKKLVFWIVLDICVLYRELHQVELAKDILAAYMDNFGDVMPDEVRIEIENNLQYI